LSDSFPGYWEGSTLDSPLAIQSGTTTNRLDQNINSSLTALVMVKGSPDLGITQARLPFSRGSCCLPRPTRNGDKFESRFDTPGRDPNFEISMKLNKERREAMLDRSLVGFPDPWIASLEKSNATGLEHVLSAITFSGRKSSLPGNGESGRAHQKKQRVLFG